MVASVEEFQTSLCVERTIQIEAPLEIAYEALLEQLGPAADFDGTPMPMKLEAWPGGRWFRDLGENTGHWWGQTDASFGKDASQASQSCGANKQIGSLR